MAVYIVMDHKLKGGDPNARRSLVEESSRRSTLGNSFRRNNPVLPTSPEVVLRPSGSSSSLRRDAKRREAALLSPNTIVKMSFDFDTQSGNAKMEGSDPGELRKLLEWELGLDSGDLRSHAWYHGTIPRARAEEVVLHDGEFLIRDCISQPGDYVLTCHWKGQTLHFRICKTVVQPNTVYERIQYQLEDEAYDTIPDLVRSYVGGGRPVTCQSGARISTPITRTAPLSFYASKYAAQTAQTFTHGTLTRPTTKIAQESTPRSSQLGGPLPHQHSYSGPVGVSCTIIRSPAHSPPRMRRDTIPQLPTKTRNSRLAESFSLDGAAGSPRPDDKSNSSDGVIGQRHTIDCGKITSHSLPRKINTRHMSLPSTEIHPLTPSEEVETPTKQSKEEEDLSNQPPPKPSRVPSFKVKAKKPQENIYMNRVYAEIDEEDEEEKDMCDLKDNKITSTNKEHEVEVDGSDPETSSIATDNNSNPRHSRISEVYQPSGSDSGNGSGDSVQTSASDARKSMDSRDSQVSFGDGSSVQFEEDSLVEEEPVLLSLPNIHPETAFDLEDFNTLLLPAIENRPLDATALKGIKNILIESGSRILAAHLTRADLTLLCGLGDIDLGLGVTSGIELLTLPHGFQLRQDLIERTECMKLLVVVTILTCDEMNERAEVIYKWIQVAIDTKTAMGNLYGFTNIMLGLCMPEIQKLQSTWHTVRQKYTDAAFNFEAKLRSTLKNMNECTNPQAPNTTIPHLLPLILLYERTLEDIENAPRQVHPVLQWETSSDYGLQLFLAHLQEARNITQNLVQYRRNANQILSAVTVEDLTLDMFRTEFHLKFLFGSKGATACRSERNPKFHRVVMTLADKCEAV
ncbi:breast cancer anti-estrogen resistance protein 3 homolog isoform X6 [Oratosquilla oratoria]|uniref:breast cancer anti-estrogen resistance protein 3 homolog isoform X6 n=1 Tax=Oratosquilla oratoria TaxID=337810 RepID=UPI003F75E67C